VDTGNGHGPGNHLHRHCVRARHAPPRPQWDQPATGTAITDRTVIAALTPLPTAAVPARTTLAPALPPSPAAAAVRRPRARPSSLASRRRRRPRARPSSLASCRRRRRRHAAATSVPASSTCLPAAPADLHLVLAHHPRRLERCDARTYRQRCLASRRHCRRRRHRQHAHPSRRCHRLHARHRPRPRPSSLASHRRRRCCRAVKYR